MQVCKCTMESGSKHLKHNTKHVEHVGVAQPQEQRDLELEFVLYHGGVCWFVPFLDRHASAVPHRGVNGGEPASSYLFKHVDIRGIQQYRLNWISRRLGEQLLQAAVAKATTHNNNSSCATKGDDRDP